MKKRALILLTALQIFFSAIPAIAAPQTLWGFIYDQKNLPISGVQVSITQGGKAVSTSTTGADGAYSFNIGSGAYSMRLTPPNNSFSALLAFDIDAPLQQGLNFYLTPPTPGRSFITGYVKTPAGFDIEGSASFGAVGSIDKQNGFFRLTPTAGTNAAFGVTGNVRNDGVAFKVVGKTPIPILQDMLVDYNLPLYKQRIRVVNESGSPIAGAFIDGGVGSLVSTSTPNVAMNSVEGLGDFDGTWRVYSGMMRTDKDGYVTLSALATSKPAPASFTILAGYPYPVQTIQTTVGNGDVVLKLAAQQLPSIKGTVKDSSGKLIPGISVKMMTNNPGSSSQFGGGGGVKADGTFEFFAAENPNYVLSVEYVKADDQYNTFVYKTYSDKSNASIPQKGPIDIVVPLQTTRVRVVDGDGKPLANSYVSLKPNPTAKTEYSGKVTLFSGAPAHDIYSYSTGVTDANGYVTLPTVKFDAEVDGLLFAGPPAGSAVTFGSVIQKMGLGKDMIITLRQPFVNVTGRIFFTDGTPLSASSKYGPSFNSTTNAGGAQITSMTADGRFTGRVPAGIVGRWNIGCGAIDKNRASDFVPCLSGGPTTTASKDWSQDLPVPTSKTQIQVVTAEGKGIPNVKVLVNSTFYSQASVQLFPGEATYNAWYISTATTDANGIATITNLKYAPQKVYLEITPDPTSRYQARGLAITIGDNSKNVIVLQIPKPTISNVLVSTINGVRTATIVGENFAGVFGVTAGSFSFNEFTNKTGAVTRQGFTVVSATQITFPIPTGLTTGIVTVTNGGGTATSGMVRFS